MVLKRILRPLTLTALGLLVAVGLSGCGTSKPIATARAPESPVEARPRSTPQAVPQTPGKPGGYYADDGPGEAPANLEQVPDAVPTQEPPHRFANRPYEVFGKSYVPNLQADRGPVRGIASWYGRKFHGQKTSSGEVYDMYRMTAAHKTLPIPSFARVTNPATGRSVVVRVNDRGPFHGDRMIDLSFAAAHRLGIAQKGSGLVQVERVFVGDPLPILASSPNAPNAPNASNQSPVVTQRPAAVVTSPAPPARVVQESPREESAAPVQSEADGFVVQLGAFSSIENAANLRDKIQRDVPWLKEPVKLAERGTLIRVVLGPYRSKDEALLVMNRMRTELGFSGTLSKP